MPRKGTTIYRICKAVAQGDIEEPFGSQDLISIGIPEGTAHTFLSKHRVGNPGGNRVFFERLQARHPAGWAMYRLARKTE